MDLLPSFSFETWLLLIALLGLVMLYAIWPYSFFKKLGIRGPTPLPFLGTIWGYRKGLIQFDTKCHEKYGKIWGIYDGRQPVLAVLEPSIVKAILVKECYSTFTNRRSLKTTGVFKHILPRTEDEQWKRIRTLLSPTFTSGKLKEMFPIIKHYGEVLMRNVQKKMENGETVAVKDIFGTYSLDVITSTSFGVNLDSMNNPKDPFLHHIKRLTTFKPFNPINVLITVFPFSAPLLRALNLNIFPRDSEEFFVRSFAKIKETRLKEGQGSRVDFLQLMIDSQGFDGSQQSKDHSYKGLTDTEILAQSLIFVFAGYEPTSNSLSFMAYLLATHPDVQQKLQNEIDSILPNKAPVTYDAIRQLEYLDMVLSETQRLYPLGGRIERMCKKDVEINGVTIPKGTVVIIPPYVLHRNPEYWPQPEEFRPERFSKDNRETMDLYTYLPFGAGPRNCIGMRFALVAIKVAIVILLQHFSFRVCKETPIPLMMSNKIFLIPEKPIVLKLVPRNGSQEKEE